MQWFKCLNADSDIATDIIDDLGYEAYGQIVRFVSRAIANGMTRFESKNIASLIGVKKDRATRLFPYAEKLFRETRKLYKSNEYSVNPDKSEEISENPDDFDPAKPVSDEPILEKELDLEKEKINSLSQSLGEVVSFSKPQKNKSNNHAYSEEFETWWLAYPNRQDKIKTYAAFKKALQVTNFDALLAGAKAYSDKVQIEKTEKRFQKHSTTFLSAGGWESDHTPSVPQASGLQIPQGTMLSSRQIARPEERTTGYKTL